MSERKDLPLLIGKIVNVQNFIDNRHFGLVTDFDTEKEKFQVTLRDDGKIVYFKAVNLIVVSEFYPFPNEFLFLKHGPDFELSCLNIKILKKMNKFLEKSYDITQWVENNFKQVLSWVIKLSTTFREEQANKRIIKFLECLLKKCQFLDIEVRIQCVLIWEVFLYKQYSLKKIKKLLNQCLQNHYGMLIQVGEVVMRIGAFNQEKNVNIYRLVKNFITSKNYDRMSENLIKHFYISSITYLTSKKIDLNLIGIQYLNVEIEDLFQVIKDVQFPNALHSCALANFFLQNWQDAIFYAKKYEIYFYKTIRILEVQI